LAEGAMNESRKFFADELEKLLAMPLNTKQDLDAWYGASKRLRDTIRSHHPEVEYDGETYHFLVDAEIRQRDKGYREWQEGEVRRYIEQVREEK
jgi:hypothetical protein